MPKQLLLVLVQLSQVRAQMKEMAEMFWRSILLVLLIHGSWIPMLLITWLLTRSCSVHLKNGNVKLGDDEELGVKGSGDVQIKMYDGIVRTFDTWYVPGLRKNLYCLLLHVFVLIYVNGLNQLFDFEIDIWNFQTSFHNWGLLTYSSFFLF